MQSSNKATRIELLNFTKIPMRAFHVTWVAFFLCFFGWFGIAPLMPVIRDELKLTKEQIDNTIIASVAITIFARLFVGWFCDRAGPRIAYSLLLILGAIPVVGIGLSYNYESFLLFRLAIGAIGASFVVTQYHTSLMFAPNCVGTANATAAGWGNTGGGVAQATMPLLLHAFVAMGLSTFWGWRLSMIVPGIGLFFTGIAYYFLTKDTPEGNFSDLRKSEKTAGGKYGKGAFLTASKDVRVWILGMAYAGCFGVELAFHNLAALYFTDKGTFHLDLKTAGLIGGIFGGLAIFARPLGGIFSDKMGIKRGLRGRVLFLVLALAGEGAFLALFSIATSVAAAVGALILFGLCVHMSAGATYAIIPFINKKAVGSVAGIIGAGGNMGAVAAGVLFKVKGLTYAQALFYMGFAVLLCAGFTFLVTFSPEDESIARAELARAIGERLDMDMTTNNAVPVSAALPQVNSISGMA